MPLMHDLAPIAVAVLALTAVGVSFIPGVRQWLDANAARFGAPSPTPTPPRPAPRSRVEPDLELEGVRVVLGCEALLRSPAQCAFYLDERGEPR